MLSALKTYPTCLLILLFGALSLDGQKDRFVLLKCHMVVKSKMSEIQAFIA
jgi:hypothetical protein